MKAIAIVLLALLCGGCAAQCTNQQIADKIMRGKDPANRCTMP